MTTRTRAAITLAAVATCALFVAASAGAAHAQASSAGASATPITPASFTPPAASKAPASKGDSTGRASVEEGRTGLLTLDRESYGYVPDGRRDPFRSLMVIGDLRPLVSDLRLVVVAFDPKGGSVAILRDLVTDEQYRVREGQQIGRMRIAAIRQKEIVFTIEEFGFSRQETLALGDPTNARTQQ